MACCDCWRRVLTPCWSSSTRRKRRCKRRSRMPGEASLALARPAAGDLIARVVLPAAVPGMLTGAILGAWSGAAGETAAIIPPPSFTRRRCLIPVFQWLMSLPVPYVCAFYTCRDGNREKLRPPPSMQSCVDPCLVLVLGMNPIGYHHTRTCMHGW